MNEVLTDEEIEKAQAEAYCTLVSAGYNGGLCGEQWDLASARAIEKAILDKLTAGVELPEPEKWLSGDGNWVRNEDKAVRPDSSRFKEKSYTTDQVCQAIAADRAARTADKCKEWKDHETAQLVNKLTQIAIEFHNTEQLRERIARDIRPFADRARRVGQEPVAVLKVYRGEICYKSQEDGQSYGMWIPAGAVKWAEGAEFYAAPVPAQPERLLDAASKALESLEYHTAQTRTIWETEQAIASLRAALQECGRKV